MEKSKYQDLDQHVTILGWFYIALSLLGILVAAIVFVTVTGGGFLFSSDAEAIRITFIVGTTVTAFLILLSAPGIVTGIGLLKRKSWARVVAIVLGILNLMNFPFGTALGIYTLWVLMQDESADVFTTVKSA